MTKETGGPAFPVAAGDGDIGSQVGSTTWQFPGMTLRDYFAANAMQGICADPSVSPPNAKLIAELSYEVADAMIAERVK